jgi:predicted nuclease of restriction endonuclease-like (RecB) superfamily
VVVESTLFERTALSRKPDQLLTEEVAVPRERGELTPGLVPKDPYVLDFLGLNDRYLEKDLEDAILRELETFLLELGAGFSFVARQKRLQIDNDDYSIDLLFYNRRLRRLVVIELKLGEFKASDKCQVELYLRWLAKHELCRRTRRWLAMGELMHRPAAGECTFAERSCSSPTRGQTTKSHSRPSAIARDARRAHG